jgi:hypothetical protein
MGAGFDGQHLRKPLGFPHWERPASPGPEGADDIVRQFRLDHAENGRTSGIIPITTSQSERISFAASHRERTT